MTEPAMQTVTEPQAPVLLFREQALQQTNRQRDDGDVLRLAPGWVRWTSAMVLALLVAATVAVTVIQVPQYAVGQAVVRSDHAIAITAATAGLVERILVGPGDTVQRGQLLLTLSDAAERAELARIEHDWKLQLVARLRHPHDQQSGTTLSSLAAELTGLRARIARKRIHATAAGRVGDIRIRQGLALNEGDAVLSIHPRDQRLTILALLPGAQRPLLAAGQPVQLELSGHRGSRTFGRVVRIAGQVIGPAEARRFLGPDIADGIELPTTVALAWVEIDSATFRAASLDLPLHEGMQATASVRTGRCRLYRLLIPGLSGPATD